MVPQSKTNAGGRYLCAVLGVPLLAAVAWTQPTNSGASASATSAAQSSKRFTCDLVVAGLPESSVCTHRFVNGGILKTLSVDGMVITAGFAESPKYIRVSVEVVNNTSTPIDVIPERFSLEESTPRSKELHFIPAQKVAAAETKQAGHTNASRKILGGFANAASAFGGSAQQQSNTQTTSSGTISTRSSDGTNTAGTYEGTSTSTTSSPDPAAQQRAREQIQRRNSSIAAANAQRSAFASSGAGVTIQTALSANTVMPNRSVAGFAYFEGDKKAGILILRIPVGNSIYEFKFE